MMSHNTISVEVFSSFACNRCQQAKDEIQQLIINLQQEFPCICFKYNEVDVVENIDRAVSLAILTVPSIVINGEKYFNSMPALSELNKQLLMLINQK